MAKMLETWSKFVLSERQHFVDGDDNLVDLAFSQAERYYSFILIIFERYQKASNDFIQNQKAFQATFEVGQHPMTDEQIKLFNESRPLTTILHLEIESFYLFAKIMLDKIARALEFYFGKVNKRPLDSHDDLKKNLEAYTKTKALNLQPDLLEYASKLKKDISDHRDYQIAHEKSPRTLWATGYDPEGNTRIMSTRLYPKEKDVQVETKALKELLNDIDEYLKRVITFVDANRSKTARKLK